MRTIERKLLRDLWHLRGPVLAAALVVACGVASFVSMRSTYDSLRAAQEHYYAAYRFADVFVHLKRAPQSLLEHIRTLPGVARVDARVVADVTLDVPGLREPATGRLVSIPEHRQAALNDVHLQAGRYVEPGRDDEVLASAAFATANGLRVGDGIGAVVNGRWRTLRIVGVALSPEYVYEVGPGSILPDNKRFGVLWMSRAALGPALDMDGAFNDLAIALAPGAAAAEVRARLDALLVRYGGLTAYGRDEHLSNRYFTDELGELEISSTYIPAIFLGVVVFLLYAVLSRLVATQRAEIALLKAFGYGNRVIAGHYLQLALVTTTLGQVIGTALGLAVGQRMTRFYENYFHFPELPYVVAPGLIVWAVGITALAGALGALSAARRAAALPPAEAMRPEPPARFHSGWFDSSSLGRVLPASGRMIARNIARRGTRSALSVLGIAMAVGVLVVGRFLFDAVDHLVHVQFNLVQRDDVTVLLHEARGNAARHELERLAGVLQAEPFRAVAVQLRAGHRSKRVALRGMAPDAELLRLIDTRLRVVPLAPDGLVLTRKLATILGVDVGDVVTVEVLEGGRPVREVPVAALADEMIGIGAYMDARALARVLREEERITGASLRVDPAHADALYARLKRMPAVAGVVIHAALVGTFEDVLQRTIRFVSTVNVLFACVIAFGMVYNGAQIALSERANELASLRVLGFTRREVAVILLGEQAVLTAAAIPLGFAIGYGLCWLLVPVFDREFFRIPLVLSNRTFAYAFVVVAVAALLSGLVVARRIARLDLVAVLKTRE